MITDPVRESWQEAGTAKAAATAAKIQVKAVVMEVNAWEDLRASLERQADAADRQGRAIMRATWALMAATLVVAAITALQLLRHGG